MFQIYNIMPPISCILMAKFCNLVTQLQRFKISVHVFFKFIFVEETGEYWGLQCLRSIFYHVKKNYGKVPGIVTIRYSVMKWSTRRNCCVLAPHFRCSYLYRFVLRLLYLKIFYTEELQKCGRTTNSRTAQACDRMT